ncbi:acyltransferase family protein [Flavobacterium sp.]|uniref:acyltransferase family protein n=1 Tax=Flavobacterium sp. TaxID=239 RepID=UPI0040475CAE
MERINWIDQLKGFAIFLMVYAHNFPVTEKYIYSFHMPLFLIISGFFLPKEINLNKIKIRFKKIIIPYFFWAFFLFLFWVLIAKDIGVSSEKNLSTTKNFIGIFYAQGSMEYMDWGIPLWFLPMLFSSFCFVFFIKKIIKNEFIQFIVSFVFLLIGSIYKGPLPWSINVALIGTFFILFGNQLFKYLNSINKVNSILIVTVCLCIHFILFQYNSKIDMYRSRYGELYLFIINALLASTSIILIFKNFPKFKFLAFIGKHTIVILALQLIALSIIKLFLMIIFKYSDFNFNELEKLVISIIQIIILIPAYYFINKYLPIANGGNKN